MWLGVLAGWASGDASQDGLVFVFKGISGWRDQMCCHVCHCCFPGASMT